MMRNIEEERAAQRQRIKRRILGAIAILCLLVVAGNAYAAFYNVPPGHTATVYSVNGGLKPETYGEGLHVRLPILEQERVEYTALRTIEYNVSAASVDNQEVDAKVAVTYGIDASHLTSVQRMFLDDDAISRFVDASVQESVKNNTVRYGYAEVLGHRFDLKTAVESDLRARLDPKHLVLDQVFITNVSFSPELTAAIERSQVASQDADTAQNQVKVSEANADKQRAEAKGDADAAFTRADGEARSIEREGAAIRENPEVLNLRMIEKWNGQLPAYAGGTAPFSLLVSANATGAIR